MKLHLAILAAIGLNSTLALAQTSALPSSAMQIERGKYLATAADCAACHTAPNQGKPFAGGYGIASPMGTVYSSNITPSKTHGIGNYTLEQFRDVLKKGINARNTHLYPVMPYPSYSKIRDADIADLYAYFMHGVEPVDEPMAHKTQLAFPYDQRWSLAFWNALFLNSQPFVADSSKSEEWNRGAYLANALAHCGTCHTPRNALMGEDSKQFLAGSQISSWYAPNITSDPIDGIGNWSTEDIATYLKTGQVTAKGQAAGPMGEAVQHSFQYLTDTDIKAIATYIKTVPAIRNSAETKPRDEYGAPYDVDLTLRGKNLVSANNSLTTGEALYSGYCSSCHQSTGSGVPDQIFPSLFHNSATGDINPSNLVAVILNGVDRTVGDEHVYMPSFSGQSPIQSLSDEQISKIANFVLQRYGNPAVSVSVEEVATLRNGGPEPLLMKVRPYIVPGIIVVLIVLAAFVFNLRRKKHHPN